MDDELKYLIHFFNDKQHLFKTISMAGVSQVDEICNTISSQKGWFWFRFSSSERQGYLKRRLFVERTLYEDYTREYGSLKEKVPVFFYLIPKITEQKAIELARQRTMHGETKPQVLMVKIADIEDTNNMTFTLSDSHTAYWQRIQEAGIGFGREKNIPAILPDHNKVFPFAMIEQIHRKYENQEIRYEIQIWDYQLLENMPYRILEREEP